MTGGVALLRRPPVVRGAIGRVELTQCQVAIFDPEDLRLVVGRSWCAIRARTECGFYATAWDPGLGRNLEMHRLLMGQPKAHFVDHVNGNGLDNRRANLRLCTPSENLRNRIARKPAGASSQFLGVSLHRQSGRWQAQVRPEPGERINLGRFDQEIDAAVARDDFIRTHCPSPFWTFNFPMPGERGINRERTSA